ncbi:hypothetical protein NMY22_g19465 [Coprinellus aureogranulatus]|nr:hypothetical protein NMY22_g19465 [Coprinellus aureogranulatus]
MTNDGGERWREESVEHDSEIGAAKIRARAYPETSSGRVTLARQDVESYDLDSLATHPPPSMLTRNDASLAVPHVRGKLAVVVFVFTLLAFVVESQLTQYVQTNLQYRHPFFLFYVVHSTFSLIFPLHLLYLKLTTSHTTSAILRGLSIAVTKHLVSEDTPRPHRFPRVAFARLVFLLTIGVTYPGLLWFAAISLASTLITTHSQSSSTFNGKHVNSSLWFSRRLGRVAVVYGGASQSEGPNESHHGSTVDTYMKPTAPLLGNLLTLVASFGYGLYQVLYKIYAALPTDPEVTSDALYQSVSPAEDNDSDESEPLARSSPSSPSSEEALYPPPFGLHPNLLTSLIGVTTFFLLGLIIPVLHMTGVEPFALPPNLKTAASIAGIALGGMVFNAGFMVLLGVWGPIVTSVGNLLTIVLMLISDIIFGSGFESLTFWSLLGSGVIVLVRRARARPSHRPHQPLLHTPGSHSHASTATHSQFEQQPTPVMSSHHLRRDTRDLSTQPFGSSYERRPDPQASPSPTSLATPSHRISYRSSSHRKREDSGSPLPNKPSAVDEIP